MKRTHAALLSLFVLGCEKSPTAPTAALRPGLQLVEVGGWSISSDPLYPPCVPLAVPRDGTSLSTKAMLTREGSEWVARAAPGAGNFELRFHETAATVRGFTVTGSIRGTAVSLPVDGLLRDVRGAFSGPDGHGEAQLEGETLSPVSTFVGGRMTGTIRFSDRDGNFSTCTAVQWTIQADRSTM